jgi:phospholipid/cholesterol/gamma-HCH transport system substrate-binding protein
MRKELSVGLPFVVALVALGVILSRLAKEEGVIAGTRTYYAFVDDLSGLLSGSAVRVAGINVGSLERKSIQDGRARLNISVVPTVEVHADAHVTIRSIGYLGDRYLDLAPGSGVQARRRLRALARFPARAGRRAAALLLRRWGRARRERARRRRDA